MLLKHYLDQGVSKAELSRRFGVSRATIHHWTETGQLDRDLAAGARGYAPRPLVAHKLDLDPSRKSGGALHRLHCFCLEFDGACEVQRRVPTDWIIEPIDVSGHGSFSLAS